MFQKDIYIDRRFNLKRSIKNGIILFIGNDEEPINYKSNNYRFRQDSSFLYYIGIDKPKLIAALDIDNNLDILFGDNPTIDDKVWSDVDYTINECAINAGMTKSLSLSKAGDFINEALESKRTIHFLPQYRASNLLIMENLLHIKADYINKYASKQLIKTIVKQRLRKEDFEIKEIQSAIDISRGMYDIAFSLAKDGMCEQEITAAVEGYASKNGTWLSFPTILTKKGAILHNNNHSNILNTDDMFIMDSGVESKEHYASDITRTIPVNGKFTPLQADIFDIVLKAQENSISLIQDGIRFIDIHLNAAKVISQGLKDLGFLKGSLDYIMQNGVYALFYPHGIGHPLGLDVHDMEGLGEDYVGYDNTVKRSNKLGLSSLRFAKRLQAGYVMTIEPGIYFIPRLIKQWSQEGRFKEFLNYDLIEKQIDFGGIRIEDDILTKQNGFQNLSKHIPKRY